MNAEKRIPLDLYVRHGSISTEQHRAGLRLWRDYLAARERHQGASRESAKGFRRMTDISARLDARTRCRAALAAAGPVLAPVLLHVVCLEETAQSWASANGAMSGRRARNEGIVALRLALDALAIHYGLSANRGGPVSTWSLPAAAAHA